MSAADGTNLLAAAKLGKFQDFAKLLTWLERSPAEEILQVGELYGPRRAAFRLGITGPPGAGKSTLVAALIESYSQLGLRVGVMAVDPSSPFSQGAVLGDRIRYKEHWLKSNVFIRSLGTRGSLGGLSGAAYFMARAFDVCSFDVLLLETVGVGQTELDVLHVADQVCVVLVPESGDSIQAMKAGLMEIANVFVVNKGDRPGADALKREIEASIHDASAPEAIEVFKCVATDAAGVPELMQHLEILRGQSASLANRTDPVRLRFEARAYLRRQWEMSLDTRLAGVQTPADVRRLLLNV